MGAGVIPAVSAVATAADRFWARHHVRPALVLPNVWDPVSARAFADAGFAALATSSSAMAATLGYDDGERTPVPAMLAAITQIVRSVEVPVTADVEGGYGLAPAELVDRLLDAGVVGCNIEDSCPGTTKLRELQEQADYLAAMRDRAAGAVVINARVDAFLGGAVAETEALYTAIDRARAYLAAGADCTYPILAPPGILLKLVAGIAGPVNALRVPGGLSIAQLSATGVARISFGGSLHDRATEAIREIAGSLGQQRLELVRP